MKVECGSAKYFTEVMRFVGGNTGIYNPVPVQVLRDACWLAPLERSSWGAVVDREAMRWRGIAYSALDQCLKAWGPETVAGVLDEHSMCDLNYLASVDLL